jgi:hypothetical protein
MHTLDPGAREEGETGLTRIELKTKCYIAFDFRPPQREEEKQTTFPPPPPSIGFFVRPLINPAGSKKAMPTLCMKRIFS